MSRLAALLCGAMVLVACAACSLVDRAGTDLQTAGSNISHPAHWLRNEFGGQPAPPRMTAGHSPGVGLAPEGSSLPRPDTATDVPCGWANIKPNC